MASLWQKWSQDAAHAFQDFYSNLVLGDETGQSAKLVVVVNSSAVTTTDSSRTKLPSQKHPTLASLGVTFCEINDRAYVQTVTPNSLASQHGVLPKDCVQYAAVLAEEWKDPMGGDLDEIQQHALEREEAGQRISYKELKNLLQTGVFVQQQSTTLKPRSVPSMIRIASNPCASSSKNAVLENAPPDVPAARPVVLVFRRTTQRPTTSLPIWPHYRMDDECDVACQILQSLATSSSPLQPESHTISEGTYTAPPASTEETVEAATIRAMIQKAVGLAFLRSNKVVLGVSLHAGSGIVIARLPDGTWSAPSAIGIAGVGLGLQLGVEVAHSILILQTQQALEHFQKGGSFTVGANVGAAVMGHGREAVGAASLSGVFCGSQDQLALIKDDEYHAETSAPHAPSSVGIAPLVAYAKSQGLYVGLSLEGSRIHGRNDVNARSYQFGTRRKITAHELLTGKVGPPHEAAKLYEALHQVEYTHELLSLPKLPQDYWGRKPWFSTSRFPHVNDEIAEQLQAFEDKFREFLYGGVDVWRVRGRKRERRTLWLYAPEGSSSLQLGFVSKLMAGVEAHRTHSNSENGDDRRSVTSEDVTLDSALMDNQSILNNNQGAPRAHVELSRKNSVGLTDVLSMTQEMPSDLVLERPDEESKRVITLDTTYNQLLFVAKTDQEACVLMSGIRVLLESETRRCGVRGGIGKDGGPPKSKRGGLKSKRRGRTSSSGYASSDMEDNDDVSAVSISSTSEGWKSLGRSGAPGRNFLRGQAAANDHGYPQYVLGQLLVRDIAKNVHLPLPLPLCRVLLLDSSSPVISQWEHDRGDQQFEKTPWTFPPATPRERDQYQSEHQLIASGSMCGAHRTISYHRQRHGQLTRLFETQIVDSDDSEKLAFQIHERMPRRGFGIKVKILLRSYNNECEATVLTEIRPVGKDMSNPEAVHKAFLLVIEELRERYGPEGKGLLSGFLDAVNTFKEDELPPHTNGIFSKTYQSFGTDSSSGEEKKEHDLNADGDIGSKSIKLEDMLKANSYLGAPDIPEPKFLQDRSPTPMNAEKYRENYRKPKQASMPSDTFDAPTAEPVMIEVKPLPKIRLSLMPSPREEDEFNLDDDSSAAAKKTRSMSQSSSSANKPPSKSRKSWGSKRNKSRKDKKSRS